MSGTAAYRPRHIDALDGIRGLAVLIVFFFHYGGGTHSSFAPMRLFGFVNKGGWSGVVLFFVLSGFLITGILWDSFDDPHWWRKFFARRSLRIFPLYFLALILVVIGAYATHTGHAALSRIWVPALFVENFPHFVPVLDNIPSPFGVFHLWSIAVEEQFYLLWPFVLVLLARRRTPSARSHARLLCAAVFLLSALFRLYVWTQSPEPMLWNHSLPVQSGALALGGWLALSYRGPEWPRILRLAPATAILGFLAFLFCGFRSHNFETAGLLMMGVGLPAISLAFGALVALAVAPGLVARAFSMGWLRWLGNISYGVYVYHMLFLGVWFQLMQRIAGHRSLMVQNATLFLIAAAGTLAVSVLSYHLFEKQFLRLKRYFVPRTAA